LLRGGQFRFSALYTLINAAYRIADIRIPDARGNQVLLMVVLTVIGLAINLEVWQWWQASRTAIMAVGRAGPMHDPLLILLPWTVFTLTVGLKLWRVSALLHRGRSQRVERFRAALERGWLRDQQSA
jgi:hypothetical protein